MHSKYCVFSFDGDERLVKRFPPLSHGRESSPEYFVRSVSLIIMHCLRDWYSSVSVDIGRKNLFGAPLGAWTVQPLTTKTPGFLAITDTVMVWIEFAGIVIDGMILHSTSTPDVLGEVN